MNRYILIRRMRWPAILMLLGVIALLHQLGAIEHFWHMFIPLLLILIGVFMLAERAILAAEGGFPPYPGAPYAGAVDPSTGQPPAPQSPVTETSIVPSRTKPFEDDPDGGQQ
jgi:hypothetical protein